MSLSKPFYIEIKIPRLLYWYSKLTGTKGDATMAAFWPFLFTTGKINPKMRPFLINHELIHFAQQKEMLFFGFYLYTIFEWIWIFISKRKVGMNVYILRSTEQEAYDNMFDLDYLNKRKYFSHFKKYWKSKPVAWKEFIKKFFEVEGLPIIYEWVDEPGVVYHEHAHQGRVSFYVVEGSVTFSGGIQKTVSKGQRFDVPIGIKHTALVSNTGCTYIVAQEIEGDA